MASSVRCNLTNIQLQEVGFKPIKVGSVGLSFERFTKRGRASELKNEVWQPPPPAEFSQHIYAVRFFIRNRMPTGLHSGPALHHLSHPPMPPQGRQCIVFSSVNRLTGSAPHVSKYLMPLGYCSWYVSCVGLLQSVALNCCPTTLQQYSYCRE